MFTRKGWKLHLKMPPEGAENTFRMNTLFLGLPKMGIFGYPSPPRFKESMLAAPPRRSMVFLLMLASAAASAMAQSMSTVSTSSSAAAAPQGITVPRVNSPTMPRLGYSKYPWKTDIMATVFWVGETPTENNPTPNNKSSWDPEWEKNFGGFDDPDPLKRNNANYCPQGFTPQLNPFYIALPYNDCLDYSTHKPEASKIIPWFKQRFTRAGKTVLRGTWVAIRFGNRVCYAQWEDCGPFVTDDHEYVFGNARPKNTSNRGAGIDVSPAVRDYLGMGSSGKCDWRFVDVNEIPPGPWRSLGNNNHFVRAQIQQQSQQRSDVASRLEELKKARDAYFKQNGNSDLRVR
ncbi:hypothetical protein SAMN02745166_03306 [Prosthecobacter debontii]|uniref:Uncharacterized protein n=2 Tax=Prosthecobacter debontii TaxID=48467 RepID=A0A1T4YH28_9BACT|nr:hypothetical protein SAMN02745166_03306 [Prosthecobacter debontii]